MKKLNPDIVIGSTCAGILLFSVLSEATTGIVSIAGISLPPACPFRLVTGWDCPGCGLTRSLILAVHGNFTASYFMHIWGIPLMFILAFQIPYRFFRFLKPGAILLSWPDTVKRWISPALFLSFVLPWAVRTISLMMIRYL